MAVLTAAARLLFGWLFVSAGVDVVRKPGRRAESAGPFLATVRKVVPQLPADDVTVVRANAAVQVLAGAAMATGRAPRVAAGVLAASLIPTSVGGHGYWTYSDPATRAMHKIHFQKNAAILGGLIFAATARRKH